MLIRGLVGGALMASDPQRIRAYRKHGIERDDRDDRADDRRGRGRADIGRTAAGTQPVVTSDERDKRAEHERLETADREIGAADSALRLRRISGRGDIQKWR